MGIGKTTPNPAESLFLEDKLEVPLGKPIVSNDDSTLLYNEYPLYKFIHIIIRIYAYTNEIKNTCKWFKYFLFGY